MNATAKPVEKITAAQEELEGRFRLQHMRLCMYAEHVALLRGTRFEAKLLEGLFAAVIIHQGVLVRAYYVLMGCVSFFGVSGMAFNTAICSIRLYTGELAVRGGARTLSHASAAILQLRAMLTPDN